MTVTHKNLESARGGFAAEVLEFDRVLEAFERLAYSSLGKRKLAELGPRVPMEARAALTRVHEMQGLFRVDDTPSLAGVTDPLPREAAEVRAFDEERFVALRGFLDACGRIREWFAGRTESVPELARLAADIPEVGDLLAEIDRTLDARGRVRRDASELLGRLRRETSVLMSRIDDTVRGIMARGTVRNVLSDFSVHRRADRPVLAVRAKSSGRVKGLVHDRSQSGESVFIEPAEVIELGNRLAEARADERREVERILLALTRSIFDRAPRIDEAAMRVGEIELSMISARYAAEANARPALQPGDEGASRGMRLRAARHPLLIEQELAGEIDSVVPVDLRLGADFDMLIITGPNTGGKTLALKTAGLFALMTRAGLPVPSGEGTTVPLYARICADIGDEQEISQNLSTFASHLVRIRAGLEAADAETLILLDELGGGTDPDEGAALGEAVLEHLLVRGAPTLVSTHISKLKEFAFRHPRAENACTEFDIETLAPRYRLLVGTPGESGALVIARRMGIPDAVVDRARERTERRDAEVAALMEDVRVARTKAEQVRNDAETELDSARATRRALEEKEAEIERRSEQLEQEAQRGLEERVRDAMRQLERAKALLDQVPKKAGEPLAAVLDALGEDLSGASLTERRQAFLATLGKGSLVYLPRYRQRVLVHKVDKARREVVCKLGNMKIKVTYDEVTPYESL
ncbi:MAG: hypothetical protein GY711_22250 [bacterium]|nr:hypothetical protein [bacterium]